MLKHHAVVLMPTFRRFTKRCPWIAVVFAAACAHEKL
jgi:hypothetical protein